MLSWKILQIIGGVSEIVRRQTRALGDTGEHARPDFLAIVEGEHEIRPALTGKNAVRGSAFAFDHPPKREQGREHPAGFARRPVAKGSNLAL